MEPGNTLNPVSNEKQEPELIRIENRLSSMVATAAEIRASLDNLASRVFGPTPQEVQKEDECSPPAGAIHGLDKQTDDLNVLLSDCYQLVHRLGSIA